jgi:ion channel
MLRQLLVGVIPSLTNIAIHAAAMATVISAARAAAATYSSHPIRRLALVMVAVVLVLMSAHVGEVAIWSLAYAAVNAAPDEAERFYFAFVNFTTLGYGDMVPTPQWRLLGPITAMNGVLLFGWSTAVMFEVLRTTLRETSAHDRRSVEAGSNLAASNMAPGSVERDSELPNQ